MRRKTTLKSCFIIAPIEVNIEPIRALLADRSIQVNDALSLPPGRGSIVNTIELAIRKADFVCGIISTETSPNVLFEIGLAYGARKPLFLIVDKKADLPANLRDFFCVRASPLDIDAIQFNIDSFLEYPTKPTSTKYRTSTGPEFSAIYRDDELESLRRLEASESGLALEAFIADLLKKANMVVVDESHYPDRGADIAIWLDDIESSLGNPVLVEVKAGQLSDQRLRSAESQLRHYLTQTNAKVGLLVYLDTDGRRFPKLSLEWPLVIRLDARDLVDLLSKNELAPALIAERNKAVHGRK